MNIMNVVNLDAESRPLRHYYARSHGLRGFLVFGGLVAHRHTLTKRIVGSFVSSIIGSSKALTVEGA